jgi:hypothetical protein
MTDEQARTMAGGLSTMFYFQFVAGFKDGWTLSSKDIAAWLATIELKDE